jgi:membrane protein DedA with SNARE-associated domain
VLEAAVFWIVDRVRDWGYTGILVMMFVESSFFPFPSEVAMVPAGYLAAQGEMDPFVAIAMGLLGSLGGAFLNYYLALWLGLPVLERIGHYFFLREEQFEAAERYFEKHGEITTFVARLIPGVRQLISVPAGLARMRLARFALYTGLGAGLWSATLVGVGYWAGANEELWRPLLEEATLWVLGGMVVLVGGYVYIHRRASEGA